MVSLRSELRSLVVSPVSWAIVTAYVVFSGIFFVVLAFTRDIADLENYYSNIETTLVVLAPIVAMRSFAEERRTGSLDITLSWPVSRWTLVISKFVANTIFSWCLVSVVWLYVWILNTRAPVEVGKAAAGHIGLLMIVMMFNAIALAVSARAGSPTAAAFVGFGVLIALWILDFVPGWLGGRFDGVVSFVAPTNHIANSGRGILDLGDGLYFVAGTVLGLTLAAWWLKEPRARTVGTVLRGRYSGILLGCLIVAGVGASAATSEGQLDMTPEQRFTLTDHSLWVLGRTMSPVHVYGFVEPGSAQQVEIASLLRRYQLERSDVTLEFIDPDAQPAATLAAGARTYGQMVIEIDGRRELVDDIHEIEVTSAIQRLANLEPPIACFTVGHGERDITDILPGGYLQFATQLDLLGYVTKSVALGASGGEERLATCSVLILGGPRIELLAEEFDLLEEYIADRGRLVIFADSIDGRATAQINELLRPWGIAVRPALVSDRSSLKDDPGSIVTYQYPSGSPVTQSLSRRNVPVLFVSAQPVESVLLGGAYEELGWVSPLVTSSSHSLLDDGESGPFTLAAVADWSKVEEVGSDLEIARTRIGLVGTAEIAANGHIERLGNAEFSTRLVTWVARQEDLISAMREVRGVPRLVLTEADRGWFIRSAIIFPALAAFALLLLALVRLRRG